MCFKEAREQFDNRTLYRYCVAIANEGGIEGKLIDFGKEAEVPVPDLTLELLNFVDDVVDELQSREELEYIKAC